MGLLVLLVDVSACGDHLGDFHAVACDGIVPLDAVQPGADADAVVVQQLPDIRAVQVEGRVVVDDKEAVGAGGSGTAHQMGALAAQHVIHELVLGLRQGGEFVAAGLVENPAVLVLDVTGSLHGAGVRQEVKTALRRAGPGGAEEGAGRLLLAVVLDLLSGLQQGEKRAQGDDGPHNQQIELHPQGVRDHLVRVLGIILDLELLADVVLVHRGVQLLPVLLAVHGIADGGPVVHAPAVVLAVDTFLLPEGFHDGSGLHIVLPLDKGKIDAQADHEQACDQECDLDARGLPFDQRFIEFHIHFPFQKRHLVQSAPSPWGMGPRPGSLCRPDGPACFSRGSRCRR